MTLYLLAYLIGGATLWTIAARELPIAEFCESEDLNRHIFWWGCCIGFAIAWMPMFVFGSIYLAFKRQRKPQ